MTTRNGTTTHSSTVGANIDQKIDAIKERVRGVVDEGQERVDAMKTKVIEVKDEAVSRGNALVDRATDMIKANPLKAVAIAFGAGYIGMRLFRR